MGGGCRLSALLCRDQSYAQSSQVGVPPRGGGAGRRDRGQGGRGESYWNMVDLTMSSFYGIMELRDFRITKRESSLANN
jgi:hypothetical protein